ncbi:uncharacterized protein MELLADRAFT_111831 [Melampsora larici-populina 98AG31]|uniref:Uncharacterized protein n=1 Tax=Melampsora larici-populina (strain 98AG31 / pathotype 3-4-7) TaxID=747676 RepID=F4S4H6_MELLP|nr:uncharacterized protein MELLADRAFT_111831 [Melampsora larici-populina 98AG31]EGG00465.1 hypothetical protein MELLADRAFT_111831 [Melampsora larici-populina 98AG31]
MAGRWIIQWISDKESSSIGVNNPYDYLCFFILVYQLNYPGLSVQLSTKMTRGNKSKKAKASSSSSKSQSNPFTKSSSQASARSNTANRRQKSTITKTVADEDTDDADYENEEDVEVEDNEECEEDNEVLADESFGSVPSRTDGKRGRKTSQAFKSQGATSKPVKRSRRNRYVCMKLVLTFEFVH